MVSLRICLAYDCLYPWTVGGAERWYRTLAEGLAARGHQVTYLTLHQWPREAPPAIPGVRVVSVGNRSPLFSGSADRARAASAFGLGVFAHLLRDGRAFDVVHTAAFPYAPLVAASLLRDRCGYAVVADWWEVLTDDGWRNRLGGLAGGSAARVQRACARVPHRARTASRLHAGRLRELGFRGRLDVETGIWTGEADAGRTPPPRERRPRGGSALPHANPPCSPASVDPIRASDPARAAAGEDGSPANALVFLGRHVPDKRVEAIPPALAYARQRRPDLRAVIAGDGPVRGAVAAAAARWGVAAAVELPGFLDEPALDRLLRRALCLVLPSRREGFGLVVLDAVSRGVPVVVVAAPDNAACELVVPGVNGEVAPDASPSGLGDAILRLAERGDGLRLSTQAWWRDNAARYSADAGVASALAAYADERRRHGVASRP